MYEVALIHEPKDEMFYTMVRMARLDEEPDAKYFVHHYTESSAEEAYLKAHAQAHAVYDTLRFMKVHVGSNLGSTLMMRATARKIDQERDVERGAVPA